MTIHAAFAGRRLHLGDSASPACFQSRNPEDTYGPALTIAEMRNCAGEALLLARRRALIGTLRHLRRKHRSTCDAMADLQSVTLALLAQGEN